MGNYAYSRKDKKWVDIDAHSFLKGGYYKKYFEETPLSDEIIYNLKNNKKTKKFVEFNKSDKLYPGIKGIGKIYIDVSDVKLLLDGDENFTVIYIKQFQLYSVASSIRYVSDIVNKEIIDIIKENEDYSYIVDFIDNFNYHSPTSPEDNVYNDLRHEKALKLLNSGQRLIYELEGNYAGKNRE